MIPGGLNSLLLNRPAAASIGWIRTLGSSSNDFYLDTVVDSSGNTYSVGVTEGFPFASSKGLLTKFDADGNHQFSVTLSLGVGQHSFSSVALDGSGNIFVCGYTVAGGVRGIFSKFNNSGVHQFTKSISGGTELLEGITIDGGGNIYVVGFRQSATTFGSTDAILCKFNNAGSTIFTRIFGTAGIETFLKVAVSPNSNILVLGTKRVPEPNNRALLVFMTSAATINTTKVLGGGGAQGDRYENLVIDASNNVYVTGRTSNFGLGEISATLSKFSSTGTQSISIAVGDAADDDFYRGIALDGSGNIFTVGSTRNFGPNDALDAWLTKFNNSGVHQFSKVIRETGVVGAEQFNGIGIDSSDNIYAVGSSASSAFGNLGSGDGFVSRFNPSGIISPCSFLHSVTPSILGIPAAGVFGLSEANFAPVISNEAPTVAVIAPTVNTPCN